MSRILIFFGVVAGLVWSPLAVQSAQPEPQPQAQGASAARGAEREAVSSVFLRLRRDDDEQPLAMETSITRYVPADSQRPGLTVDLIGVVHVGEKDYYRQLNKLFRDYDAVLYELVAPKGTKVRRGQQRSTHPISLLQTVMKDVLALEFQLDHIDYDRANMVHADMSPKEFAQSMKDRGESFFQMFLRMMGHAMSAQSGKSNGSSDAQLLFALFSRDRAFRLKRIMAEQFKDMETHIAVLSGPDGSTIITQRNKRALEVLKSEIDKGKRRLAIFYGAGHLPDMETRLIRDFQLKRDSQKWLVAWSLVHEEKKPETVQSKTELERVKTSGGDRDK